MSASWIDELSNDDRRNLDNGIHPIQHRHRRLSDEVEAYLKAMAFLRNDPSPSSVALADQLEARIDIIDEEISLITAVLDEWVEHRKTNPLYLSPFATQRAWQPTEAPKL